MPPKKLYDYKGLLLSVAELETLRGVSRDVIRRRIKNGWDVALAAETPTGNAPQNNEPPVSTKVLEIQFVSPIPGVIAGMQPTLGKSYIAHPHFGNSHSSKCRPFYTIRLENGMPLIVYQDDFHVIKETEW